MERDTNVEGLSEEDCRRLRFLAVAHGLTGVERRNRLVDGSRNETSAEHSWHIVICALVMAQGLAPGVDLARVLGMLSLHDIVEIEVGDTPSYEVELRIAVADREREAAANIFSDLPGGAELLDLWLEFDGAETSEARFAQALDRLQPILLHWAGGGVVWRERGEPQARLEGIVDRIAELWSPLEGFARALVADSARLGDLVEEP